MNFKIIFTISVRGIEVSINLFFENLHICTYIIPRYIHECIHSHLVTLYQTPWSIEREGLLPWHPWNSYSAGGEPCWCPGTRNSQGDKPVKAQEGRKEGQSIIRLSIWLSCPDPSTHISSPFFLAWGPNTVQNWKESNLKPT